MKLSGYVSSANFPLLIFSVFLIFSQNQFNAAAPIFLAQNCSTKGSKNTYTSPFQINLNRLLSQNLCLQSNISRFNKTSVGDSPYQVFGLFLCKDKISQHTCQNCVYQAGQDIRQFCPGSQEAVIWYEECILRYSNRSFFSTVDLNPVVCLKTDKKALDFQTFNQLLHNFFQRLQYEVWDSSPFNIATGNISLSNNITIYGLVQCTPDLSSIDCHNCLNNCTSEIQSCSGEMLDGNILRPSCNTRYQTSPFVEDDDLSLQAPIQSPAQTVHPGGQSVPSPPSIGTNVSKRKIKWFTVVLISSIAAGFGVVVGFTALIIWKRKNARDKESSQAGVKLDIERENVRNGIRKEQLEGENVRGSQEFPLMQLDVISAATNNFCDLNKLGKGGFGLVYKGTLADGKEIAVKRLLVASTQGLTEFKNEVMLIARLQHRNLVKLLGCCLENNETLLVYEYMPNRSLDVFLFDAKMSVQLNWHRRFNIINEIARGIMYLHQDSRLRVVHRDLKASNILLDGEMNPKISDFGIARIFGGNQNEANTKRVVGTYGYMAPEYAMGGLFSFKSDVFSFGVLLLEIISGKKNNGFHLNENYESLLIFGWKLWSSGQAMQLLDTILVQSCVESEVLKCIHIGLLCVQKDPVDRPTMSSVIVMLSSETATLPDPTEPTYFVRRVGEEPAQFPIDNNNNCSINHVTLTELSPR